MNFFSGVRHGHQILLIIALLIGSCEPRKTSPPNVSELEDYFGHIFSDSEPGGAILIKAGPEVLFSHGYGMADMKTRGPVTSNTLFNLGSISKTFVANAILILRDEGKLSLEDSLIRYFPEFKNKNIAGKVRIKHLLNHTSGLSDNRRVSHDTLFYLTAKDAENWHPVTQADTLLFEPGSRFQYSNPAYNGLALIIEKVSGMEWQDFVLQKIMEPSGMTRSTITNGRHPERGVAHAYVNNGGAWIEDDYGEEPTFAAAGNGGVWSSVEELALYENALRSSTFLSSETIEESRTIKYPFADGDPGAKLTWSWFEPKVGWSWFINDRRGMQVIGHTGTQGGFIANYVSIPDKKIFFVILCNSPRDVYAMSDKLMDWLKNEDLLTTGN